MSFERGAFINCLNFLRRLERLALDEIKVDERKDTPGHSDAIIFSARTVHRAKQLRRKTSKRSQA
jgi:hypothetical protein